MDALIYKPEISATFEAVRNFSFEEKKGVVLDEARMNKLLDEILAVKQVFSKKTDKINALVEEIEQLTWLSNLDDEALILINDLISSIRDLYLTLLRQYVSFNFIHSKGIAKDEINDFKNAIEDLKEMASDLESTFFFLPNIPAFNEITKELSLI